MGRGGSSAPGGRRILDSGVRIQNELPRDGGVPAPNSRPVSARAYRTAARMVGGGMSRDLWWSRNGFTHGASPWGVLNSRPVSNLNPDYFLAAGCQHLLRAENGGEERGKRNSRKRAKTPYYREF